jgi:hypothetical protein
VTSAHASAASTAPKVPAGATVETLPNAWLVSRTDRDQAERIDAIVSVGAFLNRVLSNAGPAGLRGVFQTLHTSATGGRFVIGAARPILVTASRTRAEPPPGLRVAANCTDNALVRRVRALEPWFVSVLFEWHGSPVKLPWPHQVAHVLGSELASDLELDWLLLEELIEESK